MLKKYLDIVINHPTVKRLEGLVKTTSLPGFHGIPIYDFGAFFIQEIKRDKLKVRASAIAFNFMLALFPSIIFIFTLFSYLPVSNPDMQIYEFIHEVFPENVSGFLLATIDDVTRIQRGGVLAVVIFMSFFFSMRGVNSLIQAFHKKGQTFKIRSFIGHRLAVLRLTAYLFLFFLASLVLIVAGNYTIDALTQRLDINHQLGKFMLGAFKWLLIVLLFFGVISFIYHYGPATKRKWRFVSPGAMFATAASIIASLVFSFFVNNFNFHNEFYGSLGALIVLMLWLNLNALILLVGFEINHSIDANKNLKREASGHLDLANMD